MIEPICRSLFALMVPNLRDHVALTSRWSFLTPNRNCYCRSIPRLSAVGLAPAATVFAPSRKWLERARLRSGAVAGDVGGLRRHLAHHLGAMFSSGSLKLDFLCHGHAVFGDHRRAELLSITAFRPLAEGDFHGVS